MGEDRAKVWRQWASSHWCACSKKTTLCVTYHALSVKVWQYCTRLLPRSSPSERDCEIAATIRTWMNGPRQSKPTRAMLSSEIQPTVTGRFIFLCYVVAHVCLSLHTDYLENTQENKELRYSICELFSSLFSTLSKISLSIFNDTNCFSSQLT